MIFSKINYPALTKRFPLFASICEIIEANDIVYRNALSIFNDVFLAFDFSPSSHIHNKGDYSIFLSINQLEKELHNRVFSKDFYGFISASKKITKGLEEDKFKEVLVEQFHAMQLASVEGDTENYRLARKIYLKLLIDRNLSFGIPEKVELAQDKEEKPNEERYKKSQGRFFSQIIQKALKEGDRNLAINCFDIMNPDLEPSDRFDRLTNLFKSFRLED